MSDRKMIFSVVKTFNALLDLEYGRTVIAVIGHMAALGFQADITVYPVEVTAQAGTTCARAECAFSATTDGAAAKKLGITWADTIHEAVIRSAAATLKLMYFGDYEEAEYSDMSYYLASVDK